LIAQARADFANGDLKTRAWPAFLLSVADDRSELADMLRDAIRGAAERWATQVSPG